LDVPAYLFGGSQASGRLVELRPCCFLHHVLVSRLPGLDYTWASLVHAAFGAGHHSHLQKSVPRSKLHRVFIKQAFIPPKPGGSSDGRAYASRDSISTTPPPFSSPGCAVRYREKMQWKRVEITMPLRVLQPYLSDVARMSRTRLCPACRLVANLK
jgi:hypothetical protein